MPQFSEDQNTTVFQSPAGIVHYCCMTLVLWILFYVFIFSPQQVQKLFEDPVGAEYTVGALQMPVRWGMILQDFNKVMENKGK